MWIDKRYNGPPDSAHGGVACGLFSSAVNGRAATVRLLAPPPLEVELTAKKTDNGVVVGTSDGDIALVRPVAEDLEFELLPWLADEEVRAARKHWDEVTVPVLPYSTCFACGYDRPHNDGLELHAGEVPDSDFGVATWTPGESQSNGTGGVADWAVWAALDCPSGSVIFRYITEGLTVLLGEFTVRIHETPSVGEQYQVVARRRSVKGRRLETDVALVASDGTNLATGRATWILTTLKS